MTDITTEDDIEEVIGAFKEDFFNRFGIYPLVSYAPKQNKDKVTLAELESIVNDCLWTVYKGRFPIGIRERCRKRELIIHRQYFFKLAASLTSHTLAEIGYFAGGYDHSTVTSSIKVITTLIDIRNSPTLIITNRIKYELQIRHKDIVI